MKTLSNKIAIVVGASSGIDHATAKLFAAEDASVIVAARRQVELDTLVSEIGEAGGDTVALAGDVKNESHANDLVALALTQYGGLDIAFNKVGTLGAIGPPTCP